MANAPAKTKSDAKAPTLADLGDQACPACKTGVLYVVRYDPDALHEQGQGDAVAHKSGGGYEVHCFACTFHESRPFTPPKIDGEEN